MIRRPLVAALVLVALIPSLLSLFVACGPAVMAIQSAHARRKGLQSAAPYEPRVRPDAPPGYDPARGRPHP